MKVLPVLLQRKRGPPEFIGMLRRRMYGFNNAYPHGSHVKSRCAAARFRRSLHTQLGGLVFAKLQQSGRVWTMPEAHDETAPKA